MSAPSHLPSDTAIPVNETVTKIPEQSSQSSFERASRRMLNLFKSAPPPPPCPIIYKVQRIEFNAQEAQDMDMYQGCWKSAFCRGLFGCCIWEYSNAFCVRCWPCLHRKYVPFCCGGLCCSIHESISNFSTLKNYEQVITTWEFATLEEAHKFHANCQKQPFDQWSITQCGNTTQKTAPAPKIMLSTHKIANSDSEPEIEEIIETTNHSMPAKPPKSVVLAFSSQPLRNGDHNSPAIDERAQMVRNLSAFSTVDT